MPRVIGNRKPSQQPSRFYNITNAGADNVPVIELFGDIGVSKEPDPWWDLEGGAGTFKEFTNELRKLGNVAELRVEIHSYGGSVVVGKAIHDKLLEHPAKKTAVIYGICASAATYPALACETVQIPANSFFLIHNSISYMYGDAEDMESAAADLRVIDDSIANLYAGRTGMSVDEIRDIMAKDTWMTGTEAVSIGLADEIIEPITIDPETRADPVNFRHALNTMPDSARVWFDNRQLATAKRNFAKVPPTNSDAMTEAELKAAEKKLKEEREAFENSKKDAQNQAKTILENAQKEADKIKAAANGGAPQAPAIAPEVTTAITNAVTTATQPLQEEIENLKTKLEQGVHSGNLGGGSATSNVKKPGEEGEEKPLPKNDAELRERLKECQNHKERSELTKAYDKAKKG